MKQAKLFIHLIGIIAIAGFISGCGGGGSSLTNSQNSQQNGQPTGSLSFRIQLPVAATRQTARNGQLIPAYTGSISITVSGQGMAFPETLTGTPVNGTVAMTFTNIPVGQKTADVKALDVYNRIVARRSVTATIQAGATVNSDVNLGITITDTGFSPASIIIAPGDALMWVNEGSSAHTVTALDASFNSGNITSGQSYTHTFSSQGTFNYKCSNSNFAGVVTVTPFNLTPTGVMVSTFAGGAMFNPGHVDGPAANARFSSPGGLAMDTSGNLYVTEYAGHDIRKISPDGTVSTFAGSGQSGGLDGTGTAAQFYKPMDVAVDPNGNVYVADGNGSRIRKITPTGIVTTLPGAAMSLEVDSLGNLFYSGGGTIEKMTPTGNITTIAGSSTCGYADGNGSAAKFSESIEITLDKSGNIFVADDYNFRIRKVTQQGIVTTIAGSGVEGPLDGTGTQAQFGYIFGITIDSYGNLFVGDNPYILGQGPNLIRMISPSGVVKTIAGQNTSGYWDGQGSQALINGPNGMVVDHTGNRIYFSDASNTIRTLDFYYSNQAPVASLSANPTSGTVPLNVQFTANCTDSDGSCVSYQWDFGDGSPTNSSQNPNHTFSSAGTYTVTLTVTDNQGANAQSTATVTVALNTAKAITAYSLNGVAGTVNEGAKTISVVMPFGTNLTALVASFTTTGANVKVGATTQLTGVTPNTFTAPVTYRVTAGDATTADYVVTVTVL